MDTDDSILSMKGVSPVTGTALIFVLTNALNEGLTPEEADALGEFVTALGETMAYIASQEALNATNTNS